MLGLMVLIVIGGIIALRFLPQSEVIEKRRKENSFALTISIIRQAISLERALGDSSPCKPEYDDLMLDPENPLKVDAYLKSLISHNFLTLENFQSPVVPRHLWGTAGGQMFWQARKNLAASDTIYGMGSFEAGTEMNEGFSSPTGWVNSLIYNDNATFSTSVPLNVYDDFPWQNKFGTMGGRQGYSLRIATYTP